MCGRYSITISAQELENFFESKFSDDSYTPKYNACPSLFLPVITNLEQNKINLYKWGLIPYWSKDPKIGNKLTNARSESINEKPSFKTPLKKKRCLVICDGYYEWKTTSEGKIPYRIGLKDNNIFVFAGIWDSWKDGNNNEIKTFSIITTEANDFLSEIHSRMPIILNTKEKRNKWISNNLKEDDALNMLEKLPSDLFYAYKVSKSLNSPSNDYLDLIKEIG